MTQCQVKCIYSNLLGLYSDTVPLKVKCIYWASEASPTLGCSIEILRDIYMYVCLSSIVYGKTIQKNRMLKSVGGIT